MHCIGERYYTLNVHQLLHYADTVRNLGPLWAHSTFAFENANGWLLDLVHGCRVPDKQVNKQNYNKEPQLIMNNIMQIVKKFLQRQQIGSVASVTSTTEEASTFISDMLSTGHR